MWTYTCVNVTSKTTTTTTTTLRSHFGSSRGHSWPGLSQWLSHLPLVWFEATRAALHVWPVVGADGLVRTACMEDVGSSTTTIWRRTRLAATLLRRLAAMPRLRVTCLCGSSGWNASWIRSGMLLCHRWANRGWTRWWRRSGTSTCSFLSWLSKCPRFRLLAVIAGAGVSLCSKWRNSWLKSRNSCRLLTRSIGRSLTFQFRRVVG